jgi:peptidyl-tRNA hydrolase
MNILNIKLLKEKGVFEHPDDYIMYILINSDINMDISQLISQSCESIIKIIRINEQRYNTLDNYTNWLNCDETKIFLKASQEELLYAVNNYSDPINSFFSQHTIDLNNKDSPFTITSVAFTPIKRSDTPQFILDLKLYK